MADDPDEEPHGGEEEQPPERALSLGLGDPDVDAKTPLKTPRRHTWAGLIGQSTPAMARMDQLKEQLARAAISNQTLQDQQARQLHEMTKPLLERARRQGEVERATLDAATNTRALVEAVKDQAEAIKSLANIAGEEAEAGRRRFTVSTIVAIVAVLMAAAAAIAAIVGDLQNSGRTPAPIPNHSTTATGRR